jgi:uncharacterized membrane protein
VEQQNTTEQDHWEQLSSHKDALLSVRREMATRSNRLDLLTDHLGQWLSHPVFLIILTAFHVGWLLWNSGWIGVSRFDPSPFPVLAMIASVEAPFLAVLILMHQSRQQRIAELRHHEETPAPRTHHLGARGFARRTGEYERLRAGSRR